MEIRDYRPLADATTRELASFYQAHMDCPDSTCIESITFPLGDVLAEVFKREILLNQLEEFTL